MKPMQPGKLRHQITIVANNATARDAYGQRENTLTDVATVWASVEPVSARNTPVAKSFKATTSHQIRMRYIQGITPNMIVAFGERRLSIDGIANTEEQNIELMLFCTEVTPTPGGLT